MQEDISDLILEEHLDLESGMAALLDWFDLQSELGQILENEQLMVEHKNLVNCFRESLSIPPLSNHEPIGAVISELSGKTTSFVADLCELCLDSEGLVEEYIYHYSPASVREPSKVIKRTLSSLSAQLNGITSRNDFDYCFPVIFYGLSLKLAAHSQSQISRKRIYVGYKCSNWHHEVPVKTRRS